MEKMAIICMCVAIAACAGCRYAPTESVPPAGETYREPNMVRWEGIPTIDYEVTEEDDMVGVCIMYGVPVRAVRALNGLKEGESLRPGMILKLPAAK